MSTLVEFHQVCRRFPRAWALRHASFRVPAGSITALLGPNGAGKSTALKIALNLLRPSTGFVNILGVDSRKLGPAQLARIGYGNGSLETGVDSGNLLWEEPLVFATSQSPNQFTTR